MTEPFIVGKRYRVVRLEPWYRDAPGLLGHTFLCSSVEDVWAYEASSPFHKRYHPSCCEPIDAVRYRGPVNTETLL